MNIQAKRPQIRKTRPTNKKEKAAIALLTHYTTSCSPWNPTDFSFVLSTPSPPERRKPRIRYTWFR
jgi:hypothetical protein